TERAEQRDFVKILDFGIAKIDAGAAPLTRAGSVFGTPEYMSPEQALGQTVDARSDLYAIGVILYEMLAGEAPFRGDAVTLLRQHVLDAAPELPASLLERVDPRVAAILRRLLGKKPEDRPASAAEVVLALDEILG